MIIFAVDPGTIVTGYAFIQVGSSGMQLIDFGCIRPPAKHPLADRYFILFNAISELLEKYSPEVLVIETQFFNKNKNPLSILKLGGAKGVIIVAAKKYGLNTIVEYAPKRAKQAVTGNGNASKYQVQRMIQTLFQLPTPPEPADAADAISLAVCYVHGVKLDCQAKNSHIA